MAKLSTPKGKLVRKLGVNIFCNPKFDRLLSKKGYRPGQHGKAGKRFSTYSVQLNEKQKIKFTYGMLEKQFRNYFKKASQMKGETGLNLLAMLESRLDNVVYRSGFGSTRAESRQLVNHKNIEVNGNLINIPSYQVQDGDEIEVRERKKSHLRIASALKIAASREECDWVEVDDKNLKGVFKSAPDRADLGTEINENLIIELYSK